LGTTTTTSSELQGARTGVEETVFYKEGLLQTSKHAASIIATTTRNMDCLYVLLVSTEKFQNNNKKLPADIVWYYY